MATSNALSEMHGIGSELWCHPRATSSCPADLRATRAVALSAEEFGHPARTAEKHGLARESAIVVSHGCWRWPTRFAAELKKQGFRWIYTPHGMLEPWSLRQKRLKKAIYWWLRERRLARRADLVRATSSPEAENLRTKFGNVRLVPNGVAVPDQPPDLGRGDEKPIRILFMGRLHPKKGALRLARAWTRSRLHQNADYELLIVGSDDGEGRAIEVLLESSDSNIRLLPPRFGSEKEELLRSCRFFALPSFSEGFPMALLESMAAGLIPLISEGCNLPEAFEDGVSFKLSPNDEASIVSVLNSLVRLSKEEWSYLSKRVIEFCRRRFSIEGIAKQQAELYRSLIQPTADSTAATSPPPN